LKAILKVWLKDRKFASDIASSLMDLLKSKTADVIAQRRASRQFEEIGEKVAESLLPVFEMEGAHLDESSCTAVALAVAETLNKSSIDAELLAARDLDLTKLVGHLLASHPSATQDLSSAEAALYQRIISESSQYIIDIASQLPTFTERTIAEILKRESQLLAVTNQTLEEVRRIRAESQRVNPEVEAARFETEYRRAVVRKLDELELFGADVSAVSRRHRLSIAYVTLSVEQRTSGYREDLFPMHAKSSIRSKNADDEDGRNIVSAEDALAGSRYLLVRGLAGSGKTTLLQWMAVRSASQSFEGQLADWNNTVPFFIRLRQCVEAGLPAPEDWPRLVTPAITAIMPDHWVHHQLTSGRAIVLVDGVDELPQSQRSAVREWLKELVEAFHDARFIVSSRPHAVEEGWMEREGFDDAELQPMELADISAFIDHWHDAVREGIRDEEEKAELLSLAGHLKGVVQQNRPIRNLATSPLLCAMLCALHRDRRQQLPSDRIELYEAGCQMLLERRDSERRVELRDYPLVSYRQKRALLQDFAYWLLANGWSEVTQERADERIALRLRDMEGISRDATGADVRRLFVERSGLLREPIPGHIDFTHRTFQEFLAAQAALDEGDLGVLVKNAHDDQWQEVIVLAAGIASKRFREELIAALIARGDQESSRRHQLHLLAVACLETALELGLEVKAEVRKHLAALIPPKNMREAKALASAGELAVPFLVRKTPQRATFTAASVRTLALIGGEAALNTLEGYKHDTRQVVVAELVRAWDAFDRSDYASRVLSSICGRGHHLEVVGSSSLEGIQHLADLNSLALFRCSQVSDLSPLALLPNLTALTLIFCKKIKDLSPLRAITKLNSFNLTQVATYRQLRLWAKTHRKTFNSKPLAVTA
jgi:hypothetical protein